MRRLFLLLFTLLFAVVATSCSQSSPSVSPTPTPSKAADIVATGLWGEAPVFQYDKPWAITKNETQVLVKGEGKKLKSGQAIVLAIYAEDARTGKVMRNDFDQMAQAYFLTEKDLGTDLYDAVKGRKVGTRILHTANDEVPLIMTIDVLSTMAKGTAVTDIPLKNSEGLHIPAVASDADGAPSVVIKPSWKPPTTLVTQPLIRGDGQQVLAGQAALIQYVAVRWSTGKVDTSTWKSGSLPVTVRVGSDALIEGLDASLTESTVGSRILAIVPPGEAFGLSDGKYKDETMVYVIDILATAFNAGDEDPE